MYDKKRAITLIEAAMKVKNITRSELAGIIGMNPSNFARAMDKDGYNFSWDQFSRIADALEFTRDEVYYIVTGKRKDDALADSIARAAKVLVKTINNR